jgi:hypothetical protein
MTNTNGPSQFLLAEYRELRAEILKRSEMQHQLISIALVALAGLTSIGLKESPIALLAYPMLVLFLSAAWSYNDIQIAQLGSYIRYRIEEQLIGDGLGWEHAILADAASKRIGARAKLATRGLFWGTECLAVGLYLLKRISVGWPTPPGERQAEIVVFMIGVVAIPLTFLIMRNQDWLVQRIAESMRKVPTAVNSGKPT